jgi:hypothetical protein
MIALPVRFRFSEATFKGQFVIYAIKIKYRAFIAKFFLEFIFSGANFSENLLGGGCWHTHGYFQRWIVGAQKRIGLHLKGQWTWHRRATCGAIFGDLDRTGRDGRIVFS